MKFVPRNRANLFASVLMTALLLIVPDLSLAAGPATQPARSHRAMYTPRSKSELLVEQFKVLEPLGHEVSVSVGEVVGPSGPSRVVNIAADSPARVQKASLALQELDNIALGAAQETKAFSLKHARAKDVANALKQLLSARDVTLNSDERTNRLLVVANEAQLKRAGELVQLLDVPAEETPEPLVKLFPIRHANLDTLTGPLGLLMPGEGGGGRSADWGVFALDVPSRQVIVKGTPQMIEQVNQLLARLDVPPPATKPAESPQAVQIRLIWLTTLPASQPQEPPTDMIDVLAELKRIGVGPLRLVTQMVVPAVVGEEFNIAGAAELIKPVELKVSGTVNGVDRLAVELEVRGEAGRAGTPKSPSDNGYTPPKVFTNLVTIHTTVVAPPGQSVVLGVSSQEDHQEVFILQVRATGK